MVVPVIDPPMPKAKKGAPRPAHKPAKKPARTGGIPSREEVLRFLEQAQGKVGKREIAKAFGIKGGDRLELKALLADMAADGELVGNRKTLKRHGHVPPVAVLEIVDRDDEGDLIAVHLAVLDLVVAAHRVGDRAGELSPLNLEVERDLHGPHRAFQFRKPFAPDVGGRGRRRERRQQSCDQEHPIHRHG
jgi:hypothetical protein